MADERRQTCGPGDAERLHDLPAGEVRAPDVSHLAGLHQVLERGQRLLERSLSVPLVDLVKVDVVRPQPSEAGLTGFDQMVPRQAGVVGTGAHWEAGLGGQQHAVATATQRLAHDLLRVAVRVDVSRVDQVDAGVKRHVDLSTGPFEVGVADVPELPPTAERHRAQREARDPQTGST